MLALIQRVSAQAVLHIYPVLTPLLFLCHLPVPIIFLTLQNAHLETSYQYIRRRCTQTTPAHTRGRYERAGSLLQDFERAHEAKDGTSTRWKLDIKRRQPGPLVPLLTTSIL